MAMSGRQSFSDQFHHRDRLRQHKWFGAGFFAWNTASSHVITAEFADPSLVTSIRLDFRNGGILGAVDATITGLAMPLSSLYNSSFPAYGEVGFWEEYSAAMTRSWRRSIAVAA